MVGPVLAALGLTEAAVEELGLYHALLQLAKDKSLRSSNLTVGFFQRFCVTDKTVDIRAETVALDSVS